MQFARTSIYLTLLCALTAGAGCGFGTSAQRGSVSGTVTWNGTPIDEGIIEFVMAGDNQGGHESRVAAPIKAGQYLFEELEGPLVGPNRVEIGARRKTGVVVEGRVPGPKSPGPSATSGGAPEKVELTRQFIPEQYNAKSTLSADVAGGDNQFDFHLTSGNKTK
ncbi:MAG: hypothetical protein V4719_29135 [Planctomycetota bacterium]